MNSIRPVIDALEQAHGHFNRALFGGRLARVPVITVQTRGRRAALGWYGREHWINGAGNLAELNLSAEDLKRDPADVLLTLAHEMVHQAAHEGDVQDCSRGGRYHNRRFAELAARAGLTVPTEPDKRHGYAFVTWGPAGSKGRAALDGLDSSVREVFALARRVLPTKPSKGRMRLYVCGCPKPFKVRCGRTDLSARCNVCGEDFKLQEGR